MSKLTSIAASARSADLPADDPRPADEADLLAAAVLRAERRMAALAEVTRIGLSLMSSLERRVLATDREAFDPSAPKRSVSDPATAVPPIFEEPAAAFAKLSRSVRLTVDLEAKADEALQRLRRGEAAALTAQRVASEKKADEAASAREDSARDRVRAQVAIAIGRESETEAEECERLAAMMERLDEDEAYIDVESRPLREIVKQLCGELDLTPDWSDWTKTGWPEPTHSGPQARPRWSPFHQVSRGPILAANQNIPTDRMDIYDP